MTYGDRAHINTQTHTKVHMTYGGCASYALGAPNHAFCAEVHTHSHTHTHTHTHNAQHTNAHTHTHTNTLTHRMVPRHTVRWPAGCVVGGLLLYRTLLRKQKRQTKSKKRGSNSSKGGV
jgi:hypothetical protein